VVFHAVSCRQPETIYQDLSLREEFLNLDNVDSTSTAMLPTGFGKGKRLEELFDLAPVTGGIEEIHPHVGSFFVVRPQVGNVGWPDTDWAPDDSAHHLLFHNCSTWNIGVEQFHPASSEPVEQPQAEIPILFSRPVEVICYHPGEANCILYRR
jgi:hypothetical protein